MTTDHGLCERCGACPRCDLPCDHSSTPVPRERALELLDRIEGGLRYAAPMLCAMCLAEKRGELTNPCRAVPTCLSRERNHAKALAATESLRRMLAASTPASAPALRPEEAERLGLMRRRCEASIYVAARGDVPWLLTLVARLAGEGGKR